MIAAKRSGTHSVAADIEHDRVPIHVKRGGDLRRQGQRLDAGAGIVRGDKAYLLHLRHFAVLGQAEIGVHHVKIQQLRASALRCRVYGEIQRKLRLSAAVISDKNIDLFHSAPH